MIFDTSVFLALLVPEPRSAVVERIARREAPVALPALATLESFDVLGRFVRDRRLDADAARRIRELFAVAAGEGHFRIVPVSSRQVAVAREWLSAPELALTALDAVYIAVAQELQEPLLTADRTQARAAKRLGITARVV